MPVSYDGKPPLNASNDLAGARVFDVRYGPDQPGSPGEQWPNNLGLAGSGSLAVSADSVTLSDSRGAPPEGRRAFLLADIANVGYGEDDGGFIVVLRTRNDDRHAALWMASKQEAAALLELLPKETTPEFLAHVEDHRRFRENLKALAPRAPVTHVIIGINVVVFVLLLIAGAGFGYSDGRVEFPFTNYGPLTWDGQYWRLITAAFVHFGVFHLAFNMYALYSGGNTTERLYGSARFAVIYLLAALAGSVASGLWDGSRNSAGASGAVFGVYGALLVFVLRRPKDIPRDVLKAVRGGAISLCVYSLAMGFAMPFVDNAAHVGGLLGGALAGLLLVRPFEPAARARPQPWRITAVAVGICAVLALIAPRPSWREFHGWQTQGIVIRQFELVKRFEALVAAADTGKLGGPAAAALIRSEVVDPWETSSKALLESPSSGLTPLQARWREAYQDFSSSMLQNITLTARRLEIKESGQELEDAKLAVANSSRRAREAANRLSDVMRLSPPAHGGTSAQP